MSEGKTLSMPLKEYEAEINAVYRKGITTGYNQALGAVKAILDGRQKDVNVPENASEEEKTIWAELKQALPEKQVETLP